MVSLASAEHITKGNAKCDLPPASSRQALPEIQRIASFFPPRLREWFLGEELFANTAETITFMSLYATILRAEGLWTPTDTLCFRDRSRMIRQSPQSLEFADWFIARGAERMRSFGVDIVLPLKERGLSLIDIAESMLYVAITDWGKGDVFNDDVDLIDFVLAPESPEFESVPDWRQHVATEVDGLTAAVVSQRTLDLARHVRRRGSCGVELKLALKTMVPEQLVLLTRECLDRAMTHMAPVEQLDLPRWLAYEDEWNAAECQQRYLRSWLIESGSRVRSSQIILDQYTSADRIRMTPKGVELCFVRSSAAHWYRVEASGEIYQLNDGAWVRDFSLYVDPLLAQGEPARGDHEVLSRFICNLSVTQSKERPLQNLAAVHRDLHDHLASMIDQPVLDAAIALTEGISRKPARRWEIYAIARSHGLNSTEFYRVRQFTEVFPHLVDVVNGGFITTTVAPGRALRKQFAYWNAIRSAATAPVDCATPALLARSDGPSAVLLPQTRFAVAIVTSIDPRAADLPVAVTAQLAKDLKLNSVFERRCARREHFLRWSVTQLLSGRLAPANVSCLYAFFRETGYRLEAGTTPTSLTKRWSRWVVNKAHGKPDFCDTCPTTRFGAQWLPDANCGTWRIRFIDSPAAVFDHSAVHCNCLGEFIPAMIKAVFQAYSLTIQDQPVATIGVWKEGSSLKLGQCKGPGNIQLDNDVMDMVEEWFSDGRSTIDA